MARRDAREAAIAALDRRDRTVSELVEWLAEREYPPEEVEAAVSELIELGALDDERYAELFADEKRELGGWGPERIAAELTRRGIERSTVERVCAAEGREQQLSRARSLLAGRGETIDDDRARSRALGFLTRRGYDYELAYEAIRGHEAA